MKFDFRAQAIRLIEIGKAKIQSIRSGLAVRSWRNKTIQSTFQASQQQLNQQLNRAFRVSQQQFQAAVKQWQAIRKQSSKSTALQLVALGAAALMVVLAVGSIQTIARTWANQATAPTSSPAPQPKPSPQSWAGLPTAPSQPAPSANAGAPAAKKNATPNAAKPAQPPSKSAPAAKPAAPTANPPVSSATLAQSNLVAFTPRQEAALADPSNYGNRVGKDIFGKPVHNDPLIVLHETVGTADSAINMVQTAHSNENDQSSYHSIIRLDGTVVYTVPPEKRAFGAGNSVFVSSKGQETVRTHRQFPPSVNNFAYHISLETPPDGYSQAETHSGYTDAQYRSLAWLIAHTSVPDDRITTHRAIDRSSSRIDPRSFDAQKFFFYLHSLPRPYLEPQSAG